MQFDSLNTNCKSTSVHATRPFKLLQLLPQAQHVYYDVIPWHAKETQEKRLADSENHSPRKLKKSSHFGAGWKLAGSELLIVTGMVA